jgi:hypothetical protein
MSENIDHLLTIQQTAEIEGCSTAEIYNRLSRKEYQAYKDGPRKTLIPKSEIMARRERVLKPATYGDYGERGPP